MSDAKKDGNLTYDGRFKYVFKSKNLRFFVAYKYADADAHTFYICECA